MRHRLGRIRWNVAQRDALDAARGEIDVVVAGASLTRARWGELVSYNGDTNGVADERSLHR